MITSMHHRLWASLGFAVSAIAFVASASVHEAVAQSKPRPKASGPQRTGPITWQEFESWVAKGLEIPCQQVLPKRGIQYADPETLADIMAKFPDTPERGVCRDAARALMPGAPDVALVEKEGPALLEQLGQAVRSRNDAEASRLVHPALMVNKERVYAVFADDGPQVLQKFTPTGRFDRVGVQFYRLTNSESLYRVEFALLDRASQGLVVREILPGAEVFLREEQATALGKLRNMFRALNSKDTEALKDLVTPGLFEPVRDIPAMSGGSLSEQAVSMTPSVSTVDNSTRPVVRVGYLTRTNKKLEFDVDFERIDGELKVVRLRDTKGGVIALDPDINNYVRRRYGMSDGPRVDHIDYPRTEEPCFQQAADILAHGKSAIHTGKSELLLEFADCVIDFVPQIGYGLRASAHHIRGNYTASLPDARRAIEAGGTVYFPVRHHTEVKNPLGLDWGLLYQPVLLAVSKEKVSYLFVPGQPVTGREEIEIPVANLTEVHYDNRRAMLGGPRPYLTVKFRNPNNRDREATYNFTSVAAHCQHNTVIPPALPPRSVWEPHVKTLCGSENNYNIITRVPSTWKDEIGTIMQSIHLVAPHSVPGKR